MRSAYIDGTSGKIPLIGNDHKVIPLSIQKRIVKCALPMMPQKIYICDGTSFEWNYICSISSIKMECGLNGNDEEAANKLVNDLKAHYNSQEVKERRKMYTISSGDGSAVPPYDVTGGEYKPLSGRAAKELKRELTEKFVNCMRGRYLWVVPFSIGPIGGSGLLKGVQLTDSPAMVLAMHAGMSVPESSLTVSSAIWDLMTDRNDDYYLFSVHSIGKPEPWFKDDAPHSDLFCGLDETFVIHDFNEGEVWSFGSNIADILPNN